MVKLNSFKLARMKMGLDQQSLARLMGCSESLITKWETRRSNPKGESLVKLAALLNCNPEDLLEESVPQ